MLKWISLGKLNRCLNISSGGVYLIVHKAKYNRVMYVGTTNCFERRIKQHFVGYTQGHRTIWRVEEDQDSYELMSSIHIRNYIKHFKQLAIDRMVWASTTIEKSHAENLLLPSQKFDTEWQSYFSDSYLPNLEVWALRIEPYNARKAVMIESAIQQRLTKAFTLGRYFNHPDLSILGKIDFNKYKVIINDEFLNTPDVDEASKLILSSLNIKTIPKIALPLIESQLETIITKRLTLKKERLQKKEKIISSYANFGKKWELVDLEKLRVMLVEFNMSPSEMSQHLGRKTSSIRIQIEKNDKLTSYRWRSSINELF